MSAKSTLMARFEAALLEDRPTLVITDSFEKAMAAEQENRASILITERPSQFDALSGETETLHSFLVEFAPGIKPGTQSTTVAVAEATNALRADIVSAVNGREGYEYFRDAGFLMAEITAMGEDQRSPDMVNPHVFTCRSYADD